MTVGVSSLAFWLSVSQVLLANGTPFCCVVQDNCSAAYVAYLDCFIVPNVHVKRDHLTSLVV
jgi:hypothetical protein